MRFPITLALLSLCALTWCAGAWSVAPTSAEAPQPVLGLAVQPGGLLIRDVVPGETYDLKAITGVGLTVFNRDSRPHTYVLAAHRPSEVGNRRLPLGYSDIPDPSWFWFEVGEVTVPAQGSSEVRMYLMIPDDERYYNQHWSVSVGVVGKPGQAEMLTLAAYPRFEIETKTALRDQLRLKPAGEIGLCPSQIVLSGVAPGTRREASFILCNGGKRTHRYQLTVLPRGEGGSEGRVFGISGSTWAPSTLGVRARYAKPRIGKNRYLVIPVRVSVPQQALLPDGGWEAVILIRRDDGATNFVRILVEAAKTEGPGEGG